MRPHSFLSSVFFSVDIQYPFPRKVTPGPDLVRHFDTWMAPVPTSPDSVDPSPLAQVERESGTAIDWSDPRIQAWSPAEDREGNQAYLTSYNMYMSNKASFEVSGATLHLHFHSRNKPPIVNGRPKRVADDRPVLLSRV